MFSDHRYIAFETIVTREVRRFSRIWLQTLVPPPHDYDWFIFCDIRELGWSEDW